jgi:hypothetical protein
MKDIIPEVSRAWGTGLYSPPKYKFMIENTVPKTSQQITFKGNETKIF